MEKSLAPKGRACSWLAINCARVHMLAVQVPVEWDMGQCIQATKGSQQTPYLHTPSVRLLALKGSTVQSCRSLFVHACMHASSRAAVLTCRPQRPLSLLPLLLLLLLLPEL